MKKTWSAKNWVRCWTSQFKPKYKGFKCRTCQGSNCRLKTTFDLLWKDILDKPERGKICE